MKTSLQNIIKQFESYPEQVREFIQEMVLLEDMKIDQAKPRNLVQQIEAKLEAIIEKEMLQK